MPVVLARWYRRRASLQSGGAGFCSRAVHWRSMEGSDNRSAYLPACRSGIRSPFYVAKRQTGDIRKRSTTVSRYGVFPNDDRMSVEGQRRRSWRTQRWHARSLPNCECRLVRLQCATAQLPQKLCARILCAQPSLDALGRVRFSSLAQLPSAPRATCHPWPVRSW